MSAVGCILSSSGSREPLRDRREYIPVACGENIHVFDAPEEIPGTRSGSDLGALRVDALERKFWGNGKDSGLFKWAVAWMLEARDEAFDAVVLVVDEDDDERWTANPTPMTDLQRPGAHLAKAPSPE